MKKITPFLLSLCLCLGLNAIAANAQSTVNTESETETKETELEPVILDTDEVSTDEILLYATAGVIMDADTGDVLYYKNPDKVLYPASLTKIMTTLVALDQSQMDEIVTVSETALDVPWDSTRLGVLEGQQITMEEALYAVMVISANDISNAVAEHISGSASDFAALMNEYAADLGLENTHFTNANGLHDDNHYSSALDLAIISREALQYDAFKEMSSAKIYAYTSEILRTEEEMEKLKEENNGEIGSYVLYSHHKMVNGVYDYEYAVGGKTGYTPEARITLATFAQKDDMNLICIVMDCPGQKDYAYMDTETALNYCFDHYETLSANPALVTETTENESSGSEVSESESSAQESSEENLDTAVTLDNTSSENNDTQNGTLKERILNLLDFQSNEKPTAEKVAAVFIIVACVVLLMFIIRQLVNILKRKQRRSRYKKLKKQRLAQSAKEADVPDAQEQTETSGIVPDVPEQTQTSDIVSDKPEHLSTEAEEISE